MIRRWARLVALIGLVIGGASPVPAAPVWSLVPEQSRIAFTGDQGGAPFQGAFKRFSAEIVFDAANLADSAVTVLVDMTSADTGNRQRDELLPGADWFDAKKYPEARFATRGFRHVGGEAYEADASLTIRDVTREVSLPFRLVIHGERATMRGETTIQRDTFGVGRGDWANPAVVGRDVRVTVEVVAQRRG